MAMGRMRRIIAIILAFATIITSSGFVTACSAKDAQKVKMGDWLAMVNDSFGMFSYLSEEPYFENVTAENPYFEVVQIAAEWNVINTTEDVDLEKNVTWKEVLITLVNAGAFLQADAAEEDKIAYGIKYFDETIDEKTLKKEIAITDATELLEMAQRKWANLTFDEAVEIVEYTEGVLDYSQGESAIDDDQLDETGNLILSAEDAAQISKGDIFVLAGNDYTMGTVAYKATAIEAEGDSVKISVDSDIPLEEIVDEMYIAETLIPTSENSVIRDGNGNIIYAGGNTAVAQMKDYSDSLSHMTYTQGDACMLKNTAASVTTSFELDGCTVDLKYNLDGKLDLEASVETDNLLNVPKNSGKKLTGKVAVSLSDLSVTPVFDFSWGKLNEASVRVNYKTENEVSLKYKNDIKDVVAAPYNNGNGKYLTNLLKAKLKDKNAEGTGAKTIKICSVDVYSIGVARLCLDVNLKITASGSVTVSVTTKGTKGVEYKNGNLRVISDVEKNSDVEVKGKIEGTANIGPALYTIGLKKSLIGFSAAVGVGATVSGKVSLVDQERHLIETVDTSGLQQESIASITMNITATPEALETVAAAQGGSYKATSETIVLSPEFCIDGSAYFIVKLELSDSYCKEIVADKVKISWELIGEKNGKFAHFHIDNISTFNIEFGLNLENDLCTFKHEAFDKAEETETEEVTEILLDTETGEILDDTEYAVDFEGIVGEYLILSEMNVMLNVGEVYSITIEQLPEGYSKSDIVISSGDASIATIGNDGTVMALSSGSTVLEVKTSDGEYSAFLAITVLEPQATESV